MHRLPLRLTEHELILLDDDRRVALSELDDVQFDEARAKTGFVLFVVALLIGPVCGGGAFVIHWFAGIVFAVLPIAAGLVLLTVGVLRRPRLILTTGDGRRVWLLPHKVDFEAVQEIVRRVHALLD